MDFYLPGSDLFQSLFFVAVRLALGGFDPLFIAFARGAIAGPIAVLCALAGKYPLPTPKQALRLCLAAVGIVFIFPIFTTIALQSVPASHAATVSAILPLLTAIFGVWRKRERVPLAFWAIAAGATAVVAWFLVSRAGGLQLKASRSIDHCGLCRLFLWVRGRRAFIPGDGRLAGDLLDVGIL